MKEMFKDIPNYKGIYQISNLGRVKSLKFNKEKILKFGTDKDGYYIVTLSNEGNKKHIPVHILSAIVFHNHKPCGMKIVVNHIDLNKRNNRADNLEIITQRQNANHKHLKSSSKYVGVSLNKKSGKWRARIKINTKHKHLGYFDNEIDASKAYQEVLKTLV